MNGEGATEESSEPSEMRITLFLQWGGWDLRRYRKKEDELWSRGKESVLLIKLFISPITGSGKVQGTELGRQSAKGAHLSSERSEADWGCGERTRWEEDSRRVSALASLPHSRFYKKLCIFKVFLLDCRTLLQREIWMLTHFFNIY